jgi:hypothetical protein
MRLILEKRARTGWNRMKNYGLLPGAQHWTGWKGTGQDVLSREGTRLDGRTDGKLKNRDETSGLGRAGLMECDGTGRDGAERERRDGMGKEGIGWERKGWDGN